MTYKQRLIQLGEGSSHLKEENEIKEEKRAPIGDFEALREEVG